MRKKTLHRTQGRRAKLHPGQEPDLEADAAGQGLLCWAPTHPGRGESSGEPERWPAGGSSEAHPILKSRSLNVRSLLQFQKDCSFLHWPTHIDDVPNVLIL